MGASTNDEIQRGNRGAAEQGERCVDALAEHLEACAIAFGGRRRAKHSASFTVMIFDSMFRIGINAGA